MYGTIRIKNFEWLDEVTPTSTTITTTTTSITTTTSTTTIVPIDYFYGQQEINSENFTAILQNFISKNFSDNRTITGTDVIRVNTPVPSDSSAYFRKY